MNEFPFICSNDLHSFRFVRLPKVLIEEPEFKGLSTDSKMTYGLLLDRMSLSKKNHMVDADGRVYIIYPIEDLADDLKCCKKKAGKLLAELSNIGLITRIRIGLCKPDHIYVHWCVSPEMAKRLKLKSLNDTSRDAVCTVQERTKKPPNDTNCIETDCIDTDHIDPHQAEPADRMDQIDYTDFFRRSLYADDLIADMPTRREQIHEIINLLADICSTRNRWIRIAGADRDARLVRERLMSLTGDHIRYVLDCIDRRAGRSEPPGNIRSYIITCLYNAPTSMDTYYEMKARSVTSSR